MPVVYNINLICYNHYISTDPAFQENSYSHHIDHEIGVVPWRAHGMLVVCMFYMPYVYTCSEKKNIYIHMYAYSTYMTYWLHFIRSHSIVFVGYRVISAFCLDSVPIIGELLQSC